MTIQHRAGIGIHTPISRIQKQQMQPWVRLKAIRALTHALYTLSQQEQQSFTHIELILNQQEYLGDRTVETQLHRLQEQRVDLENQQLLLSKEIRELVGMAAFDTWCFEVQIREQRFCLICRDGLVSVFLLISIVDHIDLMSDS